MNRSHHRPRLRRGVSSAAVLTLAVAGLALCAAPSAVAGDPGVVVPDPAQRLYRVSASSTSVNGSVNGAGGGPASLFEATVSGDADVATRDPGDGSPYGPRQFERGQATGTGVYYDRAGAAPSSLPETSRSSVYLFATTGATEDVGPTTDTGVPGSASDGTTVGASSTTGRLADQSYDDGAVGDLDESLFESTASSAGLNPAPFEVGATVPLDYLTTDTDVTTTTEATWVPIDGTTDRRGIRATATGPTGTYLLLNDTVKVEVLDPASVTMTADGVNPVEVDHVDARVRVTAPDGTARVYEPSQQEVQRTFTDPSDPSLRLQLFLNYPQDGSNGVRGGSSSALVASASYSRNGADLGYLDLGRTSVGVIVPEGGVDATPSPDSDGDGLSDFAESNLRTDPATADTDGGGVDDGDEVEYNTDPLNPADDEVPPVVTDTDGDGLTDAQEDELGTDPTRRDSDFDHVSDGNEVSGRRNTAYGQEPTDPLDSDSDSDRLSDRREIVGSVVGGLRQRSDPNDKFTDGDPLSDGVEVNGYFNERFTRVLRSSPLTGDTDGDGLRDDVEVTGVRNTAFKKEPSNPVRRDTDGDGAADRREIVAGSNPADKRSTPSNP